MKIAVFVLMLSIFSGSAFSALPPQYQNEKDLQVMLEYIAQHQRVLSGLKAIDIENYIIHFDSECYVVFGRKSIQRPDGWVGPAAPLEFQYSNC